MDSDVNAVRAPPGDRAPLANHLAEDCHATAQRPLVGQRKGEAQAVRRAPIVVEQRARGEEHARPDGVGQQLTGVDALQQLDPDLVAALGPGPAHPLGHVLLERLEQRVASARSTRRSLPRWRS